MSESEIYAELTKLFHEVFDNVTTVLTPETSAADIDSWDSFNHINLIVSVESQFGIRIATADVEKMDTVGDMVALIQKKLAVPA